MIREGSVALPIQVPDTVRRDMSPFYNPKMRLNREITMAVLGEEDEVDAFFPLAGTGVRALRILKEQDVCDMVVVNDINQHFPERFRSYAERNDIDLDEVDVEQEDARSLPYELRSYDFVEIDPFGSPNKFLDSAVQELRNDGLLALTATDTAPLSGTYPTTCERKYWASPLRCTAMHEYGLRILIRKAQLVAAQHQRALRPLVSYAEDHYFKVIFRCTKSKSSADDLLDQHEVIVEDGQEVGPLWTGHLLQQDVLEEINVEFDVSDRTLDFLDTLTGESEVNRIGFVDIHEVASKLELGGPPAIADVIKALADEDVVARRTHFSNTGLKVSASDKRVREIVRGL